MLKLFKSIFGSESLAQGRYPEAVILEGMNLALDATDARIRALPGYEAKLRKAVVNTFDHVVALVDAILPETDLTRESFSTDAKMAAFFSSVDHIQKVMRDDPVLTDFLASPEGRRASDAHALLMMRRSERKVLGMELQGEIMRREVAQVAVNFSGHRFVAPAESADECRRRLYRRAYNHILELALHSIVGDRSERADLKHQRKLLQYKLKALADGQWGFGGEDLEPVAADKIEKQIDQLDQQLLNIGADDEILIRHLGLLCDILNSPEQQLWSESVHLTIDRMGIMRDTPGTNYLELQLNELHSAQGRTAIPQRVRIPRLDFPQRPDYLAEAERFLR